MVVHIDDLIYSTTSNETHEWWAAELRGRWDPTHTKPASRKTGFVLGVKVTQTQDSVSLSAPALVDKLVTAMDTQKTRQLQLTRRSR
jgi:hypothetical protein